MKNTSSYLRNTFLLIVAVASSTGYYSVLFHDGNFVRQALSRDGALGIPSPTPVSGTPPKATPLTQEQVCTDTLAKIDALLPMTRVSEVCGENGDCLSIWESPFPTDSSHSYRSRKGERPISLLADGFGGTYRESAILNIKANCQLLSKRIEK